MKSEQVNGCMGTLGFHVWNSAQTEHCETASFISLLIPGKKTESRAFQKHGSMPRWLEWLRAMISGLIVLGMMIRGLESCILFFSLSAAELAFHWTQLMSPRGLRVQPPMQTLKTFCLPFLGWRGRPLKDDLLCTSANLVCMWHSDWTVKGGAASFSICTGLLTLISWKWLEEAFRQIVQWSVFSRWDMYWLKPLTGKHYCKTLFLYLSVPSLGWWECFWCKGYRLTVLKRTALNPFSLAIYGWRLYSIIILENGRLTPSFFTSLRAVSCC